MISVMLIVVVMMIVMKNVLIAIMMEKRMVQGEQFVLPSREPSLRIINKESILEHEMLSLEF